MIPTELGLLSNILKLYLGINSFYGEIPSEIFGMTTLETFSVMHNDIEQEIPSELGLLTNLSTLGMADNYFYGPMPEELSNLENLAYFYFYRNYDLTGTVPAEYSQLTNLNEISMIYTDIEGGLNTAFCWEGKEYDRFYANCNLECSCCTDCCDGNFCEGL